MSGLLGHLEHPLPTQEAQSVGTHKRYRVVRMLDILEPSFKSECVSSCVEDFSDVSWKSKLMQVPHMCPIVCLLNVGKLLNCVQPCPHRIRVQVLRKTTLERNLPQEARVEPRGDAVSVHGLPEKVEDGGVFGGARNAAHGREAVPMQTLPCRFHVGREPHAARSGRAQDRGSSRGSSRLVTITEKKTVGG